LTERIEVTVVMETTELTPRMLRERMAIKGVGVNDIASKADMPASTLSAILRGKEYCGEDRRQRLEHAIVELGLDKEPEPERNPPVVFRIGQS
jgi:predicted transcriptional regulator